MYTGNYIMFTSRKYPGRNIQICVAGWTNDNCPDENQLFDLGKKMQEDISNVHGKNYRNIRIIDLYKATGGASDWLVRGYIHS